MKTELHALNKEFTWLPAVGPFKFLSEQQVEQFNNDGYCVIKNAIDPQVLKSVRDVTDDVDKKMEEQLAASKTEKFLISHAGKITFSSQIAARSKTVNEFANGKMFKDICYDLMGTDVQLYNDQLVYKKQGMQEHFPWHQDNGYVFIEPQQYITCWIPLVDATEENGCPWVLPGLHKLGTLDHKPSPYGFVCIDELKPKEAVCCPVQAGDLLVFSSLSPHMTGPNKTDAVRKSYIVQYCSYSAKRIFYNRETGKRYFSLKVRPVFDTFILKLLTSPLVSKILYRTIGKKW